MTRSGPTLRRKSISGTSPDRRQVYRTDPISVGRSSPGLPANREPRRRSPQACRAARPRRRSLGQRARRRGVQALGSALWQRRSLRPRDPEIQPEHPVEVEQQRPSPLRIGQGIRGRCDLSRRRQRLRASPGRRRPRRRSARGSQPSARGRRGRSARSVPRRRHGAAAARPEAAACMASVGEVELGPVVRGQGQVAEGERLEARSRAGRLTRMMLPALFAIFASAMVRNSPCTHMLTTECPNAPSDCAISSS